MDEYITKTVYERFMWIHEIEDDYFTITTGELVAVNYLAIDSTFIRVLELIIQKIVSHKQLEISTN